MLPCPFKFKLLAAKSGYDEVKGTDKALEFICNSKTKTINPNLPLETIKKILG